MATAMGRGTIKDCLYVAISGGLIYAILRRLSDTNKNLESTVATRTAALAASEAESRSREEWLQRLIASLPDVSWTTSEDFYTIFVSPNVESIFGFSVEEIYENGIQEFLGSIHPEERQRVFNSFQALFRQGIPFDEEFRAQRKDGRWIWVHDRSVRTHTENGVLFADGIMSDITARKEAELARIASDQRYRLLFEKNLAGVFRAELGGKMLECNPAFVRMLGYDSAEELKGFVPEDVFCDPLEHEMAVEGLRSNGSISGVELGLRRKDGSVLWGLYSVCVLAEEPGMPLSIEGMVIDVTERKLVADTLQKQLSLMQTITSTAPDGLVMLDATGHVTFMNPTAERMLGYSQSELLGKVIHDVCHDRRPDGTPLPRSQCPMTQVAASRKTLHGHEDVVFRKDGTSLDVSFSSAPLMEGNQIQGSIQVLQDITNRKLAERQYQALQEQFLQAQKMEAVGRLAGGIAHDFNNLLQVINGYSSLIVEEHGSDPQLAKRASVIHEAGKRAARLTQQLLDFSRKSASEAHVILLDKAVIEMTKMLRTMVGEDVELSTRMGSNGASVKINPGQLEQLVMNLALNARDAMPKGGKLHLETRCLNLLESQRKNFGFIPPGAYVRLSVSDTGCGMDADTIRHACEPFFTTKERGKGTGLGLSTVYGIVTQNGGGIQIESTPGTGTMVHICLPEAAPRTAHSEIIARATQLNGSECILLAEDEDNVRSLIAGELTRLGYRVIESGNGVDALQLANSATQPFDMLITDMIMPKLGGQELSEKILELSPTIKIIQMSGYNDARETPSGDEIPNVEHLQKPFDLAMLATVVRQALDR